MNGVFRLDHLPKEPMPSLDGRTLADKEVLLTAIGLALRFPEYYSGNWDALEECLNDLSWHPGPLRLLITHADALPAAQRDVLIDIFLDAARQWADSDRPFALYLAA